MELFSFAATAASFDTQAPMSIGAAVAIITAVVAIIGTGLTWATFYFRFREFKAGEVARRKAADDNLKTMIADVCQSITESDQYLNRRDKQMIVLAQSLIDEEFRMRSSSFVDAKADERSREDVNRRLSAVEKSVTELHQHFDAAATKIVDDVAARVKALLAK